MHELYQQIIIDHGRRPRNFRKIECTEIEKSVSKILIKQVGHNPLCGDKLILFLKIDTAENKIIDLAFQGEGCAISMASASLMTEAVKNLSKDAAMNLFQQVHRLITQGPEDQTEEMLEEKLGKLAVLEGVFAYPARVKCASLSWQTLKSCLENLWNGEANNINNKQLDDPAVEVSTE